MRGMAFACWPGPVVPACLRIVRPHGRGRRISPSGAIGGTVTGHGGASTRRTVAARRIRRTRRARVHGKGIRPKADAGAGSQEGGVSRGAAPQRARLQGYGSQQGVWPQGRHLPPGIKARLRRLRAGCRVRRGVGVLESARYSVHDKQDNALLAGASRAGCVGGRVGGVQAGFYLAVAHKLKGGDRAFEHALVRYVGGDALHLHAGP